MALNAGNMGAIQALNRSDVEKTLTGLRKFIGKSKWVGPRNLYISDTKTKTDIEGKLGVVKNPRQLSQYIVASGLLHSVDGWSYLGRAMSALLRGDPHRARHLAYYAELRAAMSLLATVGVGVFNQYHFVVDAPNSVAALRGKSPTHSFVWDCLEFWCGQATSGPLFSSIVRPNGRTLDDWLTPLGGAIAAAPQAKAWLLQWGMDLQATLDDRNARNESSYRPDGMLDPWCLDPRETLRFARDTWLALEPSASSRFEMIVSNQGFPEEISNYWNEFLCRRLVPDNISIFKYSEKSAGDKADGHAAVLARATLLLRMASGSTADLLQNAMFTPEALAFWWERLGQSRGLWEGTKSAADIIDLWADIELLSRDLSDFDEKHVATSQTFFNIGSELASATIGLGSFDRVAIWSVTPY